MPDFLSQNIDLTILKVVWGKLYKTQLIKANKIRFDETLHIGEDACFVLEYLCHVQNVSICHQVCYNYYRLDDEIFVRKYKKNPDAIYNLFLSINRLLAKLNARFELKGPRSSYGFIFNLLKTNIEDGTLDTRRFIDFLACKDVRDDVVRRNSRNIGMLLFISDKCPTLLRPYLKGVQIVKKILKPHK